MRIYECADYRAMSRQAANVISAQVIMKPDCVLGLATGSSPVGTYEQLVEWYGKKDLSFARVKSVNLDEYWGLSGTHPQSYRYFMQEHLFDHVDILPENTYVPNGLAEDAGAECARYDRLIESLGGADLQLLGMGRNGHIGFNEPGDCFELGTHIIELAPSTIDANKRFFASEDEVPRQALTMGIKHIMQAKKILLVVSGEDKADALAKALTGPVTPKLPASILRLHPDVVLVADKAALSRLDNREGVMTV